MAQLSYNWPTNPTSNSSKQIKTY